MFCSAYEGTWALEKELAVFKSTYGTAVDSYNQASLEIAFENVKNNHEHYATDEAHKRALSHFASGLALFNVAPLTGNSTLAPTLNTP